jgi:Skp family chaperone for outer membrane proteins
VLHRRNFLTVSLLSAALATGSLEARAAPENGIVKLRSAYPVSETIARIKQDVAAKKIMFFAEIDQAKRASNSAHRRC